MNCDADVLVHKWIKNETSQITQARQIKVQKLPKSKIDIVLILF